MLRLQNRINSLLNNFINSHRINSHPIDQDTANFELAVTRIKQLYKDVDLGKISKNQLNSEIKQLGYNCKELNMLLKSNAEFLDSLANEGTDSYNRKRLHDIAKLITTANSGFSSWFCIPNYPLTDFIEDNNLKTNLDLLRDVDNIRANINLINENSSRNQQPDQITIQSINYLDIKFASDNDQLSQHGARLKKKLILEYIDILTARKYLEKALLIALNYKDKLEPFEWEEIIVTLLMMCESNFNQYQDLALQICLDHLNDSLRQRHFVQSTIKTLFKKQNNILPLLNLFGNDQQILAKSLIIERYNQTTNQEVQDQIEQWAANTNPRITFRFSESSSNPRLLASIEETVAPGSYSENFVADTQVLIDYVSIHNQNTMNSLQQSSIRLAALAEQYNEPSTMGLPNEAIMNILAASSLFSASDCPDLTTNIRKILNEAHIEYNLISNWDSDKSKSFNLFLHKFDDMKDTKDEAYKINSYKLLTDIIKQMDQNEGFKETCFAIAHEAVESCGDRVAFGFINMQIQAQMYKNNSTFTDHYHYFQALTVLDIIDEMVKDKIKQDPSLKPEEIEFYLAYAIEFKDALGISIANMLFDNLYQLSEAEISLAKEKLDNALQNRDLILINMTNSEEVAKLFAREFAEIQIQPQFIVEQLEDEPELDYLKRCNEIKKAFIEAKVKFICQKLAEEEKVKT